MRKILFIAAGISMLFINTSILKAQQLNDLELVKTCADNLLKHGTDVYGITHTPMWASVIDVNSATVPIRNVPATKGVRQYDRAVGGSNYYHDVITLKVFDALTQITGDIKYSQAASDYSKSFLECTQNPETGLLGWGEHLYYNFYVDTVSVGEERIINQRPGFLMPHEFIAWTPPWERLWAIDGERTQKAIEGIKYHYKGDDPKVYQFNRHAIWNKALHQKEIMPWIKHSAIYSYSFAYLYSKTDNPKWQRWSGDAGMLYWNMRDYDTDLVFRCFYHHQPNEGKRANIGGTAYYAYWLYKASMLNGLEEMRAASLKMLEAYNKYGWDESQKGYYYELNLDGSIPTDAKITTPWKIGYGTSSVLAIGRVAAYLYETEKENFLREIAVRAAEAINKVPLPDNFTAQNIGEAINLNMDLFQITGKKEYLKRAKSLAEVAKKELWKNGFFIREKGDHYYEAKLGTGDLLAGILRIYIADNKLDVETDWGF